MPAYPHSRARSSWVDYPSLTTPVRAQDLNLWDGDVNDLINATYWAPQPSGDTSGATDTAALQALINAMPASGGELRVPAGAYYLNAALRLNRTATLRGAGSGSPDHNRTGLTRFLVASSTNDGFQVSAGGCTIEDVALVNTSGSESAGCGIKITASSYIRLNRVSVNGFYDGISVDGGIYWSLSKSYILNPVRYGVRIQDAANPDAGDGLIEGCVISCGGSGIANRNATSAIRWESGGGQKIIGNKINGASGTAQFNIGIDAEVADGVSTSDLFVIGNSIEAITTTGIQVGQQGTTGTFSNIIIEGNQIAVGGIANGIILTASAQGFISIATLVGNIIKNISTVGISLNSISQAVVSGNFISGSNASAMIQIANCDTVDVQPNMLTGNVTNGFVYIASSSTPSKSVSISRQNITSSASSQTLVQDNSASVAAHLSRSRIVYDESRALPAGVTNSGYASLYTLALPTSVGCAGFLTFLIEGVVIGGTAPDYFVISGQRLCTLSKTGGSSVSLTTIGSDTTAGTAFDYTLDTATAGSVILKVRLNSGQGGTDVAGQAYIRYEGPLNRLARS